MTAIIIIATIAPPQWRENGTGAQWASFRPGNCAKRALFRSLACDLLPASGRPSERANGRAGERGHSTRSLSRSSVGRARVAPKGRNQAANCASATASCSSSSSPPPPEEDHCGRASVREIEARARRRRRRFRRLICAPPPFDTLGRRSSFVIINTCSPSSLGRARTQKCAQVITSLLLLLLLPIDRPAGRPAGRATERRRRKSGDAAGRPADRPGRARSLQVCKHWLAVLRSGGVVGSEK